MSTSDPRIEAIFHEALERAPTERAAFVMESFGDDESLQKEVQRLLAAHKDAGMYFESPDTPEIERELARLKPEEVGEMIGPYKLLEQIGEGGFGTVWIAEQKEPVRRRVALKILKLEMDTKEVLARFEQERQALALMDHPSIAKVFDAGATQHGRPFIVMELVVGVKITDYCDGQNLTMRERLEIFMAVCQAVQHAHQKGVIHRDLKPSNILVTLRDGVPVPKVIDFGVAKAIQQRLSDLTVHTQFEQMIGTPPYMSPEQAEMSGRNVDTRTDIYALGVLLYELLTGRTPFDAATLMRASCEEMRRLIREQEPPRPSTALHTMAPNVLTQVARNRRSEPPTLIHAVRGDLDWVVMKALEKERARRYETANSFALDVQRHLRCEPVIARPPSRRYRLGRLVRRNQLVFAATGAVTGTLLIALSVVTILLLEKSAMQAEIAVHNLLMKSTGEAERRRARAPAWSPATLEETLASVARESALNSRNSLLSLQAGVLQLWFGRTGDHLATCRRALAAAATSDIADDADRAARIYCLRPSSEPQLLEAALVLAQRAVDVGRESPELPEYQLTLGMAEYRRGNYPAADQALEAAIQASSISSSPTQVRAVAGLFRAMSLVWQKKVVEARRRFTRATARIKLPPSAESTLASSDANHNDLILWLAYKEAKALLDSQ